MLKCLPAREACSARGQDKGENVAGTLQSEVAHAVRSGMDLDSIERSIIDPAPVDEDQKAALWLYAEVLSQHRSESIGFEVTRPLVEA
jgi:hypothetical protein